MKLKIVTALISLSLFFSQASNASDSDEFIGTWLLVHFQVTNESGDWVVPTNAVGRVGYINYSPEGYMSFQTMQTNRPNFSTNRVPDVPPAEIVEAFRSYVAYFGTYEIDEQAKTVIHHRIGFLNPNASNTSAVRSYTFYGKQLTLQIGENSRYVWRRP